MAERAIPLRRYLTACAAVMAPACVALASIAVLKLTGIVALLVALVAAAIVAAAIVRLYFRDIARFAGFVDQLADDREPAPPSFTIVPAAEALSTAAATLTTEWRRNRAVIDGLAASAQAIVDSLPDPLIAVDRQRRVVRANRAAVALLGAAPTGRDLSAWLRQPALLDAADTVLASTEADAAVAAVDLQLAGPPVRDLLGHIRRLPAPAADGSLALIVLHEVTAQRHAERMRADFVANASHELKTPLASLLGFIETLRGPARDDPAAQARFLGIMAEQAERMRRLVGDLLTLSQIEQREHAQPHGAVDLDSVLRSVRDVLDLRARERRVVLALEVPAGIPPVEGDRDEITTIFQNLIDNAVKFTRNGSEVSIRVAQETDLPMIRVEIADQGDGIPEHHIPRLTERFYRIDSARSRDLGGTGLGLAIVKHLVNRHRGRLIISSDVGKGATFTVLLPSHDSQAVK